MTTSENPSSPVLWPVGLDVYSVRTGARFTVRHDCKPHDRLVYVTSSTGLRQEFARERLTTEAT